MSTKNFKYDVFISYKHEPTDKKVAQYLQKALEQYKVPKEIQAKTGKKKIERVFRDEEELSVASDLSEEIEEQLKQTEFLLVVCSKKTKESIWVQREIQTFLKYRSRRYVLPILLEGEPEEAFPQIILDGGEPLAADLRGKNDKEVLTAARKNLPKIVAPILHCSYDELKQRHKAYQMKKIAWITGGIAAVSLMFGAYSVKQNIEIKENYAKKQENQSRYLAQTSEELLKNGDREAAMLVALAALPESENDSSRPLVAEARMALEESLYLYENALKSFLRPYKKVTHPTELEWNIVCHEGETPYVMTRDSDGFLYVYEAETLEQVCIWNENQWKKAVFSTEGMVIGDTGEPYKRAETDRLMCRNPKNGEVLWEKQPCTDDLQNYQWDYNVEKNQVSLLQYYLDEDYTNPENSRLSVRMTMIDGRTGKETGWSLEKTGENTPQYISMSPNGSKVAILYGNNSLNVEESNCQIAIYDCQNGSVLFSSEMEGWLDSDYSWMNEDIFVAGFASEYTLGLSGSETSWKVEAYSAEKREKIWTYEDIGLNLYDRMVIEPMEIKNSQGRTDEVASIIYSNVHVVLDQKTGHCFNRMEDHNMIQNVELIGNQTNFLYFMQTGNVYLSGTYETYTFNPIWYYNYELGDSLISYVTSMGDIYYVIEGANLHTYKTATEINGVKLTDGEGILDMAYSPDNRYFAVKMGSQRLYLYLAESGERIGEFQHAYSDDAYCFADNNVLAYVTSDEKIALYHIEEEKEQIVENLEEDISNVRCFGDSKLLAWDWNAYYILDRDGVILDSFTKNQLKELFVTEENDMFYADQVVMTDSEKYILFFDTDEGDVYAFNRETQQPVAISEDVKDLLMADRNQWNGFAKGFDRKCIRGDEMIFYGKDKTIRIYDFAQGKVTFELETDGVGDQQVVFTPDGEYLLFINRVNQLRVVSRKDGEYTLAGLERLNQHGTAYFQFSADGKELYIRSVESLSTPIMIFYQQTEPGVYKKQTQISHVYGTDGKNILVQDNGPLYLCEKYGLDELIAIAKEKLNGRELTMEEKKEYLIE